MRKDRVENSSQYSLDRFSRFAGPYGVHLAERIVDEVLDHPGLREILMAYAEGYSVGSDLSFDLQCLFERIESKIAAEKQESPEEARWDDQP